MRREANQDIFCSRAHNQTRKAVIIIPAHSFSGRMHLFISFIQPFSASCFGPFCFVALRRPTYCNIECFEYSVQPNSLNM